MKPHLTYQIVEHRKFLTIKMFLNSSNGLQDDVKIICKKEGLRDGVLKMVHRSRELGLEIIGFPALNKYLK